MMKQSTNILSPYFLAKIVVLFLVLFVSISTYGQQITGTITDDTNMPLIGATVIETGTSNGTSTDIDGNFTLTLENDPSQIEISYVGYGKQTRTVSAGENLSISLSEGETLDEVVVTALGITRESKNLTYSVQKVEGDELTKVKDANFVNTLSGKVAGLNVTTGAGGPGGAARVVLRGNTSISGNNNALFVVDGVPIDNSTGSQVGNDFGGYNAPDGASNINPDDIESISILKGAAAAALYGSRAANGVILVTTKRGTEGKISASLNSGLTFDSPTSLPRLQNTYGQGNGGVSNTTASGSWGAPSTTYADNISDFFRNARSLNNSLSLSGGTANTQAYLSYTNANIQGIIPNNNVDRNTLNLRVNNQITDRLSSDAKITYVNQDIENNVKVGEESGIVQNLYKIPRSVNLSDYETFEDENGNPTYWTTSSIYMNPYWTLNRTSNDFARDRIIILASLKYDILDNLFLQGRASIDRYNDSRNFKFYDKTLLFAAAGGSYSESYGQTSENNFDLLLSGFQDLNETLRLDYSLGTALNQRKAEETTTSASGLLVPNQFFLGYGRNISSSGFNSQREIQSVYGTASLEYNDYLIFDVSARNDWSSTLPSPYSFFYPSVGLTGIISDMATMPSWIEFLKMRASWTRVGNDAPFARLLQTYSLAQGGTNGFISRDPVKLIPDLKPELTTSIEFGVDWRILQGRLGFDFTWYRTNSENQLLTVQLPAPTGFSSQLINAGNIQNQGIELSVTGKVVRKEKFRYDLILNYARNRNKVIELSPDVDIAFLGSGYGRTAGPVVKEGGSYGDLYAEGWARDNSGNFIVDDSGLPIGSGSGNTLVGNFNPDYTLGLMNNFNFGNVFFNFLIDGRFGGVMVSGTDANLAFDGTADYTAEYRDGGLVLDAVTEDGSKNTTAINAEQLWTRVSGGRYSFGEFFTYDATNVRLREFNIGYTFDLGNSSSFLDRASLSLVGRNLFFLYRGYATLDVPGISKRKIYFDPDINLGAGNYQGVEYGNLPSTRTIGLNLQLGF